MSKPSVPQGTRDFSPDVVRRRQYIFDILRKIFENYGFQPLETPAMENLTTLMGKYGEEGDRLIFKILNNGLHEKKDADKEKLNSEWAKVLEKPYSTPVVTERALRYDLTIPFARYVVMHQNDLTFPFRRYQMQPVWRADRPQRGRYREFWQCDADVVGSTTLISEAELLCIYQEAFHRLGLTEVVIRINSRKILAGIAQYCGAPEKLVDITTAIDKLDKIGREGVQKELADRGLSDEQMKEIIKLIFKSQMDNAEVPQTTTLDEIEKEFADRNVEIGLQGIQELRTTLQYYYQLKSIDWVQSIVEIDFTLARGLNYYTGVIVEVVCNAVKMGSLGGGGRYDDLTGLFGLQGLSGVGVSFGIDRMYDVMEELDLFPAELKAGARVMLVNAGGQNELYALKILQQLREAGIAAEIYPDAAKLDKQMKYANKRNFSFVVLAADEEREKHLVSLKDYTTGEQTMMTVSECINKLKPPAL